MATAPLVRDVILRDGSALRLRSPAPEDEAAIKAFFDALSAESRYTRFHGAGRTDTVSRDYAAADGDARAGAARRRRARPRRGGRGGRRPPPPPPAGGGGGGGGPLPRRRRHA